MNSPKRWTALGVAVLMSVGSLATAGTPSNDVNAELSALKARLAELEGKQSQNWLNERRAEEVKSLVREVLADADTRASLLEGGLTAGHNGQNFFLSSEDGAFLLIIAGQLDFRYYANFRDGDGDPSGDDDDDDLDDSFDKNENGFQGGHTWIDFRGHVSSPRFGYNIRMGVDPNDNSVDIHRAYITYALSDGLVFWLGEREASFLREQNTENSHITAVERSVFNEVFTLGVVQGLGVEWDAHDAVKLAVGINDGIRSGDASAFSGDSVSVDVDFLNETVSTSVNPGLKPFYNDQSDIAFTTRIDVKLGGEWGQMADFAAWSGEEFAAFVGGAIHYQLGESGDDFDDNNIFMWTVDGSIETNGLSIFAAIVGLHTDNDASDTDIDAYGYLVEGAYNIDDKWQPFVRYEKIHVDGNDFVSTESNQFVTAGINWFINKHRAKATFDVLWALDPVSSDSFDAVSSVSSDAASRLGLLSDTSSPDVEDDQFVIRAKFQLMF